MKTKQNILEELERIQNLFEHKRGVVISEQFPQRVTKTKDAFGRPIPFKNLDFWSKQEVLKKANSDALSKGWGPKNITTDNFDAFYNEGVLDEFGNVKPKPESPTTEPPQVAPKQKPTEKPAEKTNSKTTQPEKPKSPNTISGRIEMEDDKCKPGKKYKWREVRRDYQLQKQPSTPEGSQETNSQLWKDWKSGWRPDCNKKSSISLPSAETGKLEPKVAGVTPISQTTQNAGVQPPAQLTAPNLPNTSTIQASVNQNQTGQQIYKILYDGKKVSGDPEGGGRIRIDQTGMNPEQVEKLKSYMPELGYEYFRTRSRDNRLVFTPIRQEEQ